MNALMAWTTADDCLTSSPWRMVSRGFWIRLLFCRELFLLSHDVMSRVVDVFARVDKVFMSSIANAYLVIIR